MIKKKDFCKKFVPDEPIYVTTRTGNNITPIKEYIRILSKTISKNKFA